MAEFPEQHKQMGAQLLTTAATLERGYEAFRASGDLQVFRPQLDELGHLHRQWLSDLDAFKDSLRTQGAEPKVLEYVKRLSAAWSSASNSLLGDSQGSRRKFRRFVVQPPLKSSHSPMTGLSQRVLCISKTEGQQPLHTGRCSNRANFDALENLLL